MFYLIDLHGNNKRVGRRKLMCIGILSQVKDQTDPNQSLNSRAKVLPEALDRAGLRYRDVRLDLHSERLPDDHLHPDWL